MANKLLCIVAVLVLLSCRNNEAESLNVAFSSKDSLVFISDSTWFIKNVRIDNVYGEQLYEAEHINLGYSKLKLFQYDVNISVKGSADLIKADTLKKYITVRVCKHSAKKDSVCVFFNSVYQNKPDSVLKLQSVGDTFP